MRKALTKAIAGLALVAGIGVATVAPATAAAPKAGTATGAASSSVSTVKLGGISGGKSTRDWWI